MRFLSALFSGLLSAITISGVFLFLLLKSSSITPFGPADLASVESNSWPKVQQALASKGLKPGAPIYIRIFKQESELELWMEDNNQVEKDQYVLVKTWPICTWSGRLGPKLKEGDGQSPEGFYEVSRAQMNPDSKYHLSFNLGFPNSYDRAHARTGSFLMVHGNCVSVGCYAMTDRGIEEIWLLTDAALKHGQQSFPVHAFPFRMSEENMERHKRHPWYSFWQELKPGWDSFEANRWPPKITVREGHYRVEAGAK